MVVVVVMASNIHEHLNNCYPLLSCGRSKSDEISIQQQQAIIIANIASLTKEEYCTNLKSDFLLESVLKLDQNVIY